MDSCFTVSLKVHVSSPREHWKLKQQLVESTWLVFFEHASFINCNLKLISVKHVWRRMSWLMPEMNYWVNYLEESLRLLETPSSISGCITKAAFETWLLSISVTGCMPIIYCSDLSGYCRWLRGYSIRSAQSCLLRSVDTCSQTKAET